jgi:cytidylate kinase
MAAITISRQLGSLGTQVAHEVGRCLGYRVVERQLINQAALQAGVPEMALATIDDLDLLGLRPTLAARRAYHEAVKRVIEDLAMTGDVVIVGRAGQVILKDHPDVLHVRIMAAATLRAERIARAQNIPLDAAQAQVEASDRARRTYMRRYYHVNWDDPHLYDLIINTGRLTIDSAADLICRALTYLLQTHTHDNKEPT